MTPIIFKSGGMQSNVRNMHEAIQTLITNLGFVIPEARNMKGTRTIMMSNENLINKSPPDKSSSTSKTAVTASRTGAIRFLVSIRTLLRKYLNVRNIIIENIVAMMISEMISVIGLT